MALAAAASAGAFQALPAGTQVNDDPTAGVGINKAFGVAGGDPANADVVGGSLVATKPAVPWSIFQQLESGGNKDQVFSRSFAGGAWTTRGSGTVGGRSSAGPSFTGSLNFDQAQDGEVPAIDFAGTGRAVPWATWYEETSGTGFGAENIFASRFDATAGDTNVNKWIFEGQGRGLGGGSVPVPSLNIHTNRDAENPSVAGGATTAGNPPAPWVTWQEKDGLTPTNQIFTSKGVKTPVPACPSDGAHPAQPASATGAVATSCWQQVGVERFASGATTVPANTTDTSMNVDTTRDGLEPDIAFTGPGDTVPWVVWYETGNTGTSGLTALSSTDLVFAARALAPGIPAPSGQVDGTFDWQVVGSTAVGVLDDSSRGGTCGTNATTEAACSLNHSSTSPAEDPRVAAGTMTAGGSTAPWVTWDETVSGVQQIFVSRFVGTPTPHFEIVNNGAPISIGNNASTRPDITFSGNTPYVSWREDTGGGVEKAFAGHFVNAASPTFILDESDVLLSSTATADVREPISSGCTANPANLDGATCQGSALGTPFFLFTNGTSPLSLFADAYAPVTPTTGAASDITQTSATLNGSVIPGGAVVQQHFEFGPTTAYGSSTNPSAAGPDGTASLSAAVTGLAPGSTIHYRTDVTTDFGTISGPDQTFTTVAPPALPAPAPPPPPVVSTPPAGHGRTTAGKAHVSGTTVTTKLICTGTSGTTCVLTLKLTTLETIRSGKPTAVAAAKRKPAKTKHKTVTIGSAKVTLPVGRSRTVSVKLNSTGKALLKRFHKLPAKLSVTQALSTRKTATISSRTVTFKVKAPKHHKKT